MKSETTGWQNYRKTINGTEYRLETKWQSSRKPRLWRAITANWYGEWKLTRREACSAAHRHAEETQNGN